MSRNGHQKKRVNGKSEPIFKGLAAIVHGILSGLYNIEGIACGTIRGYRGEPKVKIPNRWPRVDAGKVPRIPIVVCDAEHGECELWISTQKPGAIARILRTRLESKGHSVF